MGKGIPAVVLFQAARAWASVASGGALPSGEHCLRVSTSAHLKLNNEILGPYVQFLGMPYARPPLGTHCFLLSEAPALWPNLCNTTTLPSACPQNLHWVLPAIMLLVWFTNNLEAATTCVQNQSEGCLYLNLYEPTEDGPHTHTHSNTRTSDKNDPPGSKQYCTDVTGESRTFENLIS